MPSHKDSFPLLFIGFGTFAAILGAGILCGGGFNSVMQTPTNGPYQASTAQTTTQVNVAGVANNQIVGTLNNQVIANHGHYISLLKFYPELFNWSKIRNLRNSFSDLGATAAGLTDTNQIRADATNAYTRRHAGENAWIFALYFPVMLITVALGFVAFFRTSGYTLALSGVGLSAFMITFTLIVVVHYQAKSFVPQINDAFTDCSGLSTTSLFLLKQNVQFGSLNGPAPRRAWLCRQDWTYDNDFKTAANLVYGGASVAFVGFISLLIGFAYLVSPFVRPDPTFTKNAAPAASAYRGSSVDFDTYSEYSDY